MSLDQFFKHLTTRGKTRRRIGSEGVSITHIAHILDMTEEGRQERLKS